MATGLIFDTGALITAERDPKQFRVLQDDASARGVVPVVPTPVVAQYWRSGTGAQVRGARAINACSIVPMDLDVAKSAGALMGRAGTTDVVDAAVVVLAIQFGASVVTSDPEDIRYLFGIADVPPRVITV